MLSFIHILGVFTIIVTRMMLLSWSWSTILPIILASIGTIGVSLLLAFARKLKRNESFEIKARLVPIVDPKYLRLQVSFHNQTRNAKHVDNLCFVTKKGDEITLYATSEAEPLVENGVKSARFAHKNDGFALEVAPYAECSCFYSFERLTSGLEEGSELYLRYFDEKGKGYYAYFDPKDPHSQLLIFHKKNWEEDDETN